MIKHSGKIIVFLLLCCLIPSVFAQKIVDRILVLVNDRIITKVAFEEAFFPVRERIEAAGYGPEETAALIERYRSEMLNQMIDQTITDIAVEEMGIEISEKEVDEAVEQFRLSNDLSEEAFERALAAEGMTLDQYRTQVRDQMLRSRLVNFQVRSRIVITREQVEAYYNKNARDFGAVERYRLAHILLPFPSGMTAEQEKALQVRAESIVQRLRSGKNFAELAAEESRSLIAGPDGELGWFDAESLSPVIREATVILEEGEVSRPVRTPQGIQIFRLLEKGMQDPRPLDEVFDEIESKLYDREVNRRFQTWVTELREKVHVRILD
ncbi:periplasmic chaperone for outer membrane proteins SurA [Desulfobotulus alkaliphilus]|uniref:Periplasmic chaperone for outer membrane proteins SurA n=1 Tax=Desulfobotulus alkaliphilus TaxID=622671 RepID=A0A562RZ36_9BACT|nr:peptidylprolyl isomerase [Desulfobotulus alkaliphilus]TWI74382.1 periplasmic chaperone for outer membrane proteins SurA [Desulfobotulus alkaliphilus]